MAGPVLLFDFDAVTPAERHLVLCGVFNRQQCRIPGSVIQRNMKSRAHAGCGIFDKEDHRTADDLFAVVSAHKIEITDRAVDLDFFGRPEDGHLRFTNNRPVVQFKLMRTFLFPERFRVFPVVPVPVLKLIDGRKLIRRQ